MELTLKREPSTDLSTIGRLYVDGLRYCWTLEDPVRAVKIPGRTAIPAGRYRLALAMSPKRRRLVPWVLDVPGFDAVQIHPGNTPLHTDGCILVGFLRGTDAIYRSKDAFDGLMALLQRGMTGEFAWIDIHPLLA